MKNKKVIVALIIFAVIGFFVAQTVTSNQKLANMAPEPAGTSEDQAVMHENFPGVPASNRFAHESADQIMERFKSGTGIIFLGFKECPWCQKMAPMINQAAEDGGVTIYYHDIRALNTESPEMYQELMSYLLPYLPKDENGQPRVSTPDISIVRNGEIIWRYKMDTITDAERTPDTYWTEARKKRIFQQFSQQIKAMRKGD